MVILAILYLGCIIGVGLVDFGVGFCAVLSLVTDVFYWGVSSLKKALFLSPLFIFVDLQVFSLVWLDYLIIRLLLLAFYSPI